MSDTGTPFQARADARARGSGVAAGGPRERPRGVWGEAPRKLVAFLITAALAAGGVWWSRRQARVKAPEEPESAIWRMLDASRGGDPTSYLDCFTGGMRAQLETTARGMTPPKFSEYLRESMGRVKGVAVYDVARGSPTEASLVVEYVYQDQNERQRMTLRMVDGTWRIETAETSQRIQPLIPYGKPVTEVQ
jgi:hypothetical protein